MLACLLPYIELGRGLQQQQTLYLLSADQLSLEQADSAEMRIATGQTEIRASAEDVWEILTDFQSFSSWNPFLYSGEGSASVGSKPKVSVLLLPAHTRLPALTTDVCKFVGLMGPGKSMAFSPKARCSGLGMQAPAFERLIMPERAGHSREAWSGAGVGGAVAHTRCGAALP